MANRTGQTERKTKETDIKVGVVLEGKGEYKISTTIPFLDHMLEGFSKHSRIDITVDATGDTHIDDHHTVEDIGICIGQALKDALGDKAGILRYGCFLLPMDETLVNVAVDISGRPTLIYNLGEQERFIKNFDTQLVREFFQALVNHLGLTLHINLMYGSNDHHILEAAFKGVAYALKQAISIEGDSIPSSKGAID